MKVFEYLVHAKGKYYKQGIKVVEYSIGTLVLYVVCVVLL